MTQIIRPLSTEQERTRDVSAPRVALSAIKLLGVIASPLGAVVAITAGVLFLRQRKVRPRWYVSACVLVFVGALVAGAGRWWAQTWRQGWQVASVALSHVRGGLVAPSGFAPVWTGLSQWVGANWPTILQHQAPFGLAGGLAVGAGWAGFRSRRVASWRSKSPADVVLAEKDVQRAIGRLPQWPTNPGPDRGGDRVDVRTMAIRLGVACQGRPRPYALTVGELRTHMYVDAPTQAGKTTLLLEIAAGLLVEPMLQQRNCPLTFVTMKPDPTITARLRALAEAAGRRFWRITVTGAGGSHYNPLANRTADEIAGMVIEVEAAAAGGGFTEPHHRATGTRLLRIAARALIEVSAVDPQRWQVDYQHLALLMHPQALQDQSDRFSPGLSASWLRIRSEIDADRDLAHSMGGMRQRVANAAEGGSRDVLPDTGPDTLHLRDALDAGDVVLFDLDAGRDADTARLIGNLAIQDLVASIASLGDAGWNWQRDERGGTVRNHDGDPVLDRIALAVVDEFSALGGSALRSVFERSAGYGAGVILSTQEAGSLDDAGPTFREVVLTNANIKAIFSQGENAEAYANLWGTEHAWQESMQTFEDGAIVGSHVYKSGQGNLSQVEQFRVHPNTLRGLRPGQAVIGVRTRTGQRPTIVQIQRSGSALANRWINEARPLDVHPLNDQLDADQVDQHRADAEDVVELAPVVEEPVLEEPAEQQQPASARRMVPGTSTSRRAEPGPATLTVQERRTAARKAASSYAAASNNQPAATPTQTAVRKSPQWEDDGGEDWPMPTGRSNPREANVTSPAVTAEDDGDDWPLPTPGSPR